MQMQIPTFGVICILSEEACGSIACMGHESSLEEASIIRALYVIVQEEDEQAT